VLFRSLKKANNNLNGIASDTSVVPLGKLFIRYDVVVIFSTTPKMLLFI